MADEGGMDDGWGVDVIAIVVIASGSAPSGGGGSSTLACGFSSGFNRFSSFGDTLWRCVVPSRELLTREGFNREPIWYMGHANLSS